MDKLKLIAGIRERTGAGMMDCKKALEEANWVAADALTVLRKKGLADAAKRSGRAIKEGLVALSADGKRGVMVELNCETDFVARTAEFQELAKALAANLASGEAGTLQDLAPLVEQVASKLKENIAVRRFERFDVSGTGLVAGYIHHNGKVAALVELSAPNAAAVGSEDLAALASKILFQIVAQSPRYIDRAAVPAEDAAREREIHTDVVRKEGKPESALPKIVEGKMNKLFYQAVCLLDQISVVENKTAIAGLVKQASDKLGGPVTIRRFARYQVGEGLPFQHMEGQGP